MRRFLDLYRTTVGKKVVMAVTGIALLGFLAIHLIGNLLIFLGPVKINAYARGLRTVPWMLWAVRLVLLLFLGLHIMASVQLAWANARARPVGYRDWRPQASGYAGRTMIWSGPMIAVFVIWHVLQFNYGVTHPSFVELDVADNVVKLFAVVPVAVLYIIALLWLALHLAHGAWSMFHSIGLNRRGWNSVLRSVAAVIAFAIAGGYIVIPISVLLHILR
jgi:succinate dehydrogenase / fumarate reductase cytochrome b subunit